MPPINWERIRPINNSRQEGFEELVCQLARYETVSGDTFRRKGKPDAGIECFWTFADGSEWGWQAKYFTESPSASQWGQLDRSVKRFLGTHPNMTKLTVAMPVDLPDARIDGRISAQERWDERVDKWQDWAAERGLSVEFEYWGASELLDRLSQDQHRGRVFFWFQREFFGQQWFTEQIEDSIADAGPRYTPELDITLSIAEAFDGLGRTHEFYSRLQGYASRIRKHLPSLDRGQEPPTKIDQALQQLHDPVMALCQTLRAIEEESVTTIDYQRILDLLEESQAERYQCEDVITEETHRSGDDPNLDEPESRHQPRPVERLKYLGYDLRRLGTILVELEAFIEGSEARAANVGALLLVGEAGKGKTHLFCDVAQRRNAAGLPTVLLLGEHFAEDAWSQMLELLDLANHSRKDFLEALEAAAQVRGRKALILIDGLNESADPTMWRKRLQSFLRVLARYDWISVAISVRSSYEDMVIPDDVSEDQIVRVEHYGFAGVEYEATLRFFNFYGIEQPSVPLLNPEFQTPLFLKIFCKGIANEGITRIPRGLRGITMIFDFFVDSIYKRLKSPDKLNLSPHSNDVREAVDRIADVMAERTLHWLPVTEAERIVNADLPNRGYTDSLFYHLLSEGLLAKDCFRTEGGELVEGVRFAYQRLADHLLAQHLLNRYLTDDPAEAFEADTPLHALTQSRGAWWRSQTRGLIEALSIQIPERTGQELMSLVPELTEDWHSCTALIDSVLWRDPDAVGDKTLDFVNQSVQRWDLDDRFLNVLLTLAVDPAHPYNADFLHRRLMEDEMAERDAWWSTFLYEEYNSQGAVDRLVDWAWASNDKSHIEDESIRLCGVALIWFLTTSHRFLRDRATKALVNLLTDRLHVLRALLRQFELVNDPYVLERLLAVAYGCAMRSTNAEQLTALAQDIYDWLFSEVRPPTHILLRDYARGVVEYAVHYGLPVDVEMSKARPPYESDWVEIPTDQEIEVLKRADGSWESGGTAWAQNWIIHSVMGWDFARYVIGMNSRHSDWLSLRLDEPEWESAQDKQENFVASLNPDQQRAWEEYSVARRALTSKTWRIVISPKEVLQAIVGEEESVDSQGDDSEFQQFLPKADEEEIAQLEERVKQAEDRFCQSLSSEQLETYRAKIQPLLDDSRSPEDEPRFDMSKAQRWIVKRVFDLGWTQEKFGLFDRYHGQSQRDAYKPERVGKKYQWLAYHKILAHIADNFQFRKELSGHTDRRQYKGTWQLHVRDIDPSCVLRSKPEDSDTTPVWWSPCTYDSWNRPRDDVEWMKSDTELPSVSSLIEIVNPRDDSQWLTLNGFYSWEQPIPADIERYAIPRRDLFYFLQGYLVKESDIGAVYNWAREQDFFGRWMPEGREFIDLYLGELYWSPAYEYYDDPYMGDWDWRTVSNRGGQEIPKPILPLSERYLAERGTFDCSIDESYSIMIPIEHLVHGMSLHWNGVEGCFFGRTGQLIAFDPSIQGPGPGALLVRRDTFLEFLENQGYAVLWTLLGEKNLIGGNIGSSNWKGRTVISGAYRVTDNEIVGSLSSTFRSPDS